MAINLLGYVKWLEENTDDPNSYLMPTLCDQSNLTNLLEAYAEDPRRTFTPVPTDDPIENLFLYGKIDFYDTYPEAKSLENGSEEWMKLYDGFRLKYDGDARYFTWHERTNDPEEPLRADTMISFYTPYKEMLVRLTGVAYHKSGKPFDELIAKKGEPAYKEVNDKFTCLATAYHTMGNFMLLPDRGMNCDRYRCSQDRIDKSLYECFPGGALAKYFGDSEKEQLLNLRKWVRDETLGLMFKGGVIERDSIIPITPGNPFVAYEDMTDDELDEFVSTASWLVLARNKAMWDAALEDSRKSEARLAEYSRRLAEDPEFKAEEDSKKAELAEAFAQYEQLVGGVDCDCRDDGMGNN
jgi:hypothetical protein